MKNFLRCLVLCLFIFTNTTFAADIFVATTGNGSGDGSIGSPFRSIQHAINAAAPGDHIYLRGGTYSEAVGLNVSRGNNGSAGAVKHLFAYNGETVILDFSAQAEVSGNRGLTLNGHYWHVKGITVEAAGDNGIFIGGNHNIIEKCITRRNRDSGLQLGRYSSSATVAEWPSDNLITDCESYDNKDVANENADGFACKLTTGEGNVFRRCVAHHNIDDGWDLFTKTDTGPIGTVLLEDCIAHSNGTLTTGGTSGNGDKNGFKLGGEGIPVNHMVRRCIAFNNGKHGFTYNSNPGSIEITNCTGYKNAQRNFSFDAGTHVYKNNLSYLPASNDKVIGNTAFPNAFSNDQAWGFTVNAADFVSLTPGTNASPLASGFLHLAAGSDLINAGVITGGISHTGSLPDLGAIESDGVIVPPPATTYTLTLNQNPVPGGTATKTPNQSSYAAGEVVTLTALPAVGYNFTNWSGAASGTNTATTVTMNANLSVTANFTASGTVGGSTILQITNAATPATGLCSFDGVLRTVGTTSVVNLSNSAGKGITWKILVPAAGNYELRWRYAGGGSTAATTAKLLVNGATVNPSISFPGTSSTSFLTTTPFLASLGNGVNEIRIETTAAAAFADIEYIEVKGDNPQATDCANPIGGGGTVPSYMVTAIASPVAGGSVNLSPSGGSYASGTAVTLTASPSAGYQFSGWSGDANGTSNPLLITVNAAKNITALFTALPAQYSLTTAVIGQGSVTPSSGTYTGGEVVQITASPASGWQFSNWDGDASGTNNPLSLTMSANRSVTAVFTEIVTVPSITIRLEDAPTPSSGYCTVNGDYETEHSGADNGGYLNTINAIGNGITWKVNAPAAGNYQLKWRFANLSGDRSARVLINGVQSVTSIAFAETGEWSVWTVTPNVTVTLAAGVNTIRLEAITANGLANIDWMEVTGNNPAPAACGTGTPPASYTLTTSVSGQGAISPTSGNYAPGASVVLTAMPAAGWQFIGWSGSAGGSSNPLTLVMDGNKNITALFSDGSITQPNNAMVGYAATSGEGLSTTTGGEGGVCITISTLAELEAWALSRENNNTPQVVYINGKISSPSTTVLTIKNGSNLSVYGVGTSGELQNVGLNFRNYKNVIIRNLKIHEVFYPNDALTIDECQHVWVDHCEFYSKIGAGIGVDTYDGLLDIKNGSRYVTVSWNHFHHHMKNMLIGHTDNSNAEATDRQIRVTIHHNYFENTDGRNPSLRWGAVHLYNNYFKDITDYGLAVRQGAHALVENNVYENVRVPISTNKFDGEGFACLNGNLFTGTSGANSITQTGCDWWTPSVLTYPYTLDPVTSVTTLVPANVGVGKISFAGCGITPPQGSYTLTVTSNPVAGGTVTKSPDQSSYAQGTVVTLTAVPSAGYSFANWSGGVTGANATTTVTMNANVSASANFTATGTPGGNSLRIVSTATTATGLCSFDGALRTVGSTSVINLSNTAGRGVNFKVFVPAAGSYALQWRYAGGGSTAQETAKLLVNGTTINNAVPFPRPANSTSFLVTTPQQVNLIAGVNEIRLEVVVSIAMGDIEYLEVIGNSPQSTNCSNAIGTGVTVPITLTCPNSSEVNAEASICAGTVGGLDAAASPANTAYTYLLSGALTGSGISSVSGMNFPKGLTTVTYASVTDPTKWCSFTVKIVDVSAPVLECPTAIETAADAGYCSASISVVTPLATDACGNVTVTGSRSDQLSLNDPFPVGTTTIAWKATDEAGNISACKQEITIKDYEKPLLVCPKAAVFCFRNDHQYNIAPVTYSDNCGIANVSYAISGTTNRTGTGADASGTFQPGASTVTWTVTDIHGNTQSCSTSVLINLPPDVVIADTKVLPAGVEMNTVYPGYAPAATITLIAESPAGTSLQYAWSNGSKSSSIAVSPTTNTMYSVSVTNENGCTATAQKFIQVRDVICGNKNDKVSVCKNGSNVICVSSNAVPAQLQGGAMLGDCSSSTMTSAMTRVQSTTFEPEVQLLSLTSTPNPASYEFNIQFRCKINGGKAILLVRDAAGRMIEQVTVQPNQTLQIGGQYKSGVYFAELVQGNERVTVKLIKI